MISAPNHRLRLNGNKIVAIGLVIMMVFACKGPRQVAGKPPVDTKPSDTEKVDKVLQYDPVRDTVILVPRDIIRVDTIKWTEDNTSPIVTDDVVSPDKSDKKETSEIALLIPFDAIHAEVSHDNKDQKLQRFIQYYAGIRLALRDIDSLSLPVIVRSFDSDQPNEKISQLINNPAITKADVIVGPYDREDLDVVATFGLENETMVVSPWLPAFTPETANPFFIQLSPGLVTHANATMEFINDHMPGKKVYVVSRDNAQELNRIQLFKRSSGAMLEELLIHDSSPDLINTNLHQLLSDDHGTIFILPYFSKADETFVNSFMRKLHADKDTREAVVFGMPQWIGFPNLNANYMESLSVHLSVSSFIDVASPAYTRFRTTFFHTYFTIPDMNAFLGYDIMMWLAQQLTAKGQEGLIGQMDGRAYGLASGFDIQPVYSQSRNSALEISTPLYYENKKVRIVRFVNQDFVLAR